MPAVDSLEAAFRDEIAFSTNFPLPYRVLALGAVGILGWATNMYGLNLLGIDAATALELSTRQSKPRPSDPSCQASPVVVLRPPSPLRCSKAPQSNFFRAPIRPLCEWGHLHVRAEAAQRLMLCRIIAQSRSLPRNGRTRLLQLRRL